LYIIPFSDIHLNSNYNQEAEVNGNGGAVNFMFLIGFIIMGIAWINYINLSTARSVERAKEVGVRKVLGAGKRLLAAQFIGEALFMAFLAGIGSIVVMALALPSFNLLAGKQLVLALDNPLHLAALLSITLISGLVAGSYPSLYLSSFNPVFVLKGLKIKTGSASFIRKGLVVLQFSISIVLIVGTIIIYQQIQHVKGRNLGFNKENLVEMNMQGDMAKHFDAIKQDLLNTGIIENVALSDHAIIYGAALHKAVQLFHNRQARGVVMTEAELEEAFEAAWSNEGFVSRDHEEARLEAGRAALRRFRAAQLEPDAVIPTYVERDFSFTLDGDRVRGRWDRVDVEPAGEVSTSEGPQVPAAEPHPAGRAAAEPRPAGRPAAADR